ncbi:hypothetical protein DL93DRAFT_2123637 [Clavulina sp. PMI_390]|nr:hypothetical protein DL93DRAFT_2123637 [Clavulina sp. PMI_390]
MFSVSKAPLRKGVARLATHAPRSLRQPAPEPEDEDAGANDFILSILHASPSARDTKGYLKSFGMQKPPTSSTPIDKTNHRHAPAPSISSHSIPSTSSISDTLSPATLLSPSIAVREELVSILDPVQHHPALVKIQGPFNDRQLDSIARGMVYLQKLGLVSVIVVERDDWTRGAEKERSDVIDEAARVVQALEAQGARARPIMQAIARLGPKPEDLDAPSTSSSSSSHAAEQAQKNGITPPEAHTLPSDLHAIRCALRAGEIPVLTPFALDSHCRKVRIDANDLVAALARGMVEAAQQDAHSAQSASSTSSPSSSHFDLTPLRLMIINREGGIPSYARAGLPHLLVNLESEYSHIVQTFHPSWARSHPSALANLRLAQSCLAYMPKQSSAVIVSHRSPRSLIANLITNKPAHSSSLPHALLTGSGPHAVTPHTPTIIRQGLPIQVLREAKDVDQAKMTRLLEMSFGRKLGAEAFYKRLEKSLDFVIVAGDYAGAAIVTNEVEEHDTTAQSPMAYLDKFAVLPEHQGDGTVDFLWVALHDESYGLGLQSALNPNPGGMQGKGKGRDLVWRSRSNNPVNKWYFERSSGHMRIGESRYWSMFWCDAEEQLRLRERELKREAGVMRWGVPGLKFVEQDDLGKKERWARITEAIPSSWV